MITPTKNRVVLLPEPEEQKTASGIILQNANSKKGGTLRWAKVEAIGEQDKEHKAPLLRVGQRVLFNDYDGYNVILDKDDRIVIPISGIWAVDDAA
jgi:co-chaperonin GroES (HSP10)